MNRFDMFEVVHGIQTNLSGSRNYDFVFFKIDQINVYCIVREVEIIIIRKKLVSMCIISTSVIVRGQPSPRFHVEAWLPFWNCEINGLLNDGAR